MKKLVFVISALMAVVSLSGCSINLLSKFNNIIDKKQ